MRADLEFIARYPGRKDAGKDVRRRTTFVSNLTMPATLILELGAMVACFGRDLRKLSAPEALKMTISARSHKDYRVGHVDLTTHGTARAYMVHKCYNNLEADMSVSPDRNSKEDLRTLGNEKRSFTLW